MDLYTFNKEALLLISSVQCHDGSAYTVVKIEPHDYAELDEFTDMLHYVTSDNPFLSDKEIVGIYCQDVSRDYKWDYRKVVNHEQRQKMSLR